MCWAIGRAHQRRLVCVESTRASKTHTMTVRRGDDDQPSVCRSFIIVQYFNYFPYSRIHIYPSPTCSIKKQFTTSANNFGQSASQAPLDVVVVIVAACRYCQNQWAFWLIALSFPSSGLVAELSFGTQLCFAQFLSGVNSILLHLAVPHINTLS